MADRTLRAQEHSRARRFRFRLLVVSAIVLLLFGVPWWTLLFAGTRWPAPVFVIGTLAFAAAMVALPMTMVWGHGRRHRDGAAVTGDVLLGAVWVLFVWSVLSQVLRLALLVFGVGDPARSRIVAATVVVGVVVLLVWGHFEAKTRLPKPASPPDIWRFPRSTPAPFRASFCGSRSYSAACIITCRAAILPAVGELIAKRHARISKDIDEATALHQQAQAAGAEQETSIAQARAQAHTSAQAARDASAAEADARRHALESDLNEKLAAAEARIAANRTAAMANVAAIAQDATGAIVERLIGRAPSAEAVQKAVQAAANA